MMMQRTLTAARHPWARVVLALAMLLPAVFAAPQRAIAQAQDECAIVDGWPVGMWTGSFNVKAERRAIGIGGRPSQPGTFDGTFTLVGGLELIVGDDATMTAGSARASWEEVTKGTFEDGSTSDARARGWVTGGQLALGAIVGDAPTLLWDGAWWTAPPGAGLSTSITYFDANGRLTLAGDGFVTPEQAGTFTFVATSVSCREITGTIDAVQFSTPPATGLVSETLSGTFRLGLRRR